MKKIKSIILTVLLAVACLPAFSQGNIIVDQALNGGPITNGANYGVAATTNFFHGTNGTTTFAFPYNKETTFMFSGVYSNTTACTNIFTMDISVDNVVWFSNAWQFNVTNITGSSNFQWTVNTNIGALIYVRPGEWRWTNITAYYSNLLFKASRKIGL